MPDDLTIADISNAFLEYRSNFSEPIPGFWQGDLQAKIIATLHKALKQWQVGFENITWNQTARNVGEARLTVSAPSLFAEVHVGISGVTMNAFNPDWSRARDLASFFQAALNGLKESTGRQMQEQATTMGFHVKASGPKPFKEVLSRFVDTKALDGQDAVMFGVSAYFKDFVFVIDASGIVSGGIFIKLIRTFPPDRSFEDMGQALFEDEKTVLRRVGLKLE